MTASSTAHPIAGPTLTRPHPPKAHWRHLSHNACTYPANKPSLAFRQLLAHSQLSPLLPPPKFHPHTTPPKLTSHASLPLRLGLQLHLQRRSQPATPHRQLSPPPPAHKDPRPSLHPPIAQPTPAPARVARPRVRQLRRPRRGAIAVPCKHLLPQL